MPLQLADFQYDLPQELIAQTPAHPRDSARLMLIRRDTREISHHLVSDLPTLLPSGYDLVVNNTKVFPARIMAHKPTGGKVEILLLKKLPHHRYQVITSPGLDPGQTVQISPSLTAVVTSVADRIRVLRFSLSDPQLTEILSSVGIMPTPPYIKQMLGSSADYQTVYAKYGFSAAAPTAGLHFTPKLIHTLKQKHAWIELTLNVGLGTFLPVKADDITSHHMHREDYTVSATTSSQIRQIHASGRKLLSVGTTTMRCLESGLGKAETSSTNIFIYPPYQFQMCDALLTNFHLPGSTLLMLVSAFTSTPQTKSSFTTFADSLLGRAYAEAVRLKYRFFSFGDAMLVL